MRFTSRTFCHPCKGVSSAGADQLVPASLTSTSTRPSSSMVRPTTVWASPGCLRSQRKASVRHRVEPARRPLARTAPVCEHRSDYVRPEFSQGARHLPADATAAAGDDGRFARQVEQLTDFHRCRIVVASM